MQEDRDGLLWGRGGECAGEVVAPELHAEGADCGVGDEVWDAREFDVEGADG